MGTDAQNEANRRNARNSTGPRTEAGKKTSSRNALSHGLTAAETLLIPGESEDDFLAYRAALWAAYDPKDAAEEAEVELIISDSWRLLRLLRIESGFFHNWIANAFETQAWEDARNQGIEKEAAERPRLPESRTPEHEEAFDRIVAAQKLVREPKAILGAVVEADAAGTAALDKLSRYEGLLRKRRQQSLQQLQSRQRRREQPTSAPGDE